MVKFICNKIGRDKGLQTFKEQEVHCTYKIFQGEELGALLKDKLIEESQEVVQTASKQDLISELADVLEVIDGLCSAYSFSYQDIEKVKKYKYEERGGFEKGFYVESLEMSDNNPRVEHFRKSPEKYPEQNNK